MASGHQGQVAERHPKTQPSLIKTKCNGKSLLEHQEALKEHVAMPSVKTEDQMATITTASRHQQLDSSTRGIPGEQGKAASGQSWSHAPHSPAANATAVSQPTRTHCLQNQLQQEMALSTQPILQRFKRELPASPCTAQPEGSPGHQGHQGTQSSCSSGRNRPHTLAALQERPTESHSAGPQATCQAVRGAQLRLMEREDLMLPGSACSHLLEQSRRLQRLLKDLERQQSSSEMESRLLGKDGSPRACKEAGRLQQKNAQLAALTLRLGERARQLQVTIDRLVNACVPLPIQRSAEQLFPPLLPQPRGGEMGEPIRALLARDKRHDLAQKAAEGLEARAAADEEGSSDVSTPGQAGEELQVQLAKVTNENTHLAEENARLRGQMALTEQVQAENANLKGQLARLAEERDSTIQATICLFTWLEAAERELKAMRDRAERSQQLEREHEETKLAHREHRESLRAFPAHLKELSDRFENLKKRRQQLFQELQWLEGERSNSTVSKPQQANLGADKESVLLEAMRKQPAELRAFIARYSYDPFDGPNEQPELELPLVAGQYVYVFGDVDGDGWYVGELTDGTRGLIPSNLVEEVPGDGRPDDTTVSPETSDWWQGIDDVCPVFS